jgi:putative heavy-metal-binding protein
MAKAPPTPDLYTAAGNINVQYESLGVVLAVVAREEAGCGGGLPVGQALFDAMDDLKRQAADRGANGVIHIQYMHRTSSSPGCQSSKTNIEVYAWGTAVRI